MREQRADNQQPAELQNPSGSRRKSTRELRCVAEDSLLPVSIAAPLARENNHARREPAGFIRRLRAKQSPARARKVLPRPTRAHNAGCLVSSPFETMTNAMPAPARKWTLDEIKFSPNRTLAPSLVPPAPHV
jgi:hypothetical protein